MKINEENKRKEKKKNSKERRAVSRTCFNRY